MGSTTRDGPEQRCDAEFITRCDRIADSLAVQDQRRLDSEMSKTLRPSLRGLSINDLSGGSTYAQR